MDRIGNLTRLTTLLYVMTTHAYVYTVACTLNSRLLSGHLGVVAGTLRGFRFPICYGSVGVQLTRLRALCQGILTSECVWKNLNAVVLQVTCTMQQSSRVFFLFACLKGCFRLSLSIRNKKKANGNQQKTRLEASKPPTVFTTALSICTFVSRCLLTPDCVSPNVTILIQYGIHHPYRDSKTFPLARSHRYTSVLKPYHATEGLRGCP